MQMLKSSKQFDIMRTSRWRLIQTAGYRRAQRSYLAP